MSLPTLNIAQESDTSAKMQWLTTFEFVSLEMLPAASQAPGLTSERKICNPKLDLRLSEVEVPFNYFVVGSCKTRLISVRKAES